MSKDVNIDDQKVKLNCVELLDLYIMLVPGCNSVLIGRFIVLQHRNIMQ